MNKILVAVDGSEYSIKALLKAKEIGSKFNSDITILNVIRPMQDYKYIHNKDFYKDMERSLLSQSRKLLEKQMLHFEDYPGKVEALYKRGDPANEVVKYAEEEGFDLVVMGSRGLGVFSRTLLGSVSDKVIHHIKTSVLVVK
ncbi:MAG: universal stress protein [Tissierellaceae bacterium]|jgi:nucleotide-binding universal stress UspA family protein